MTPKYARLASWPVRAAVVAGAAGVVADLAGARSLLVTVLVLVFIAVAPAAAIAGLLRGFDLFARLVIAYVTAIAVITFIAMIMLAAGIWSPRGGLVAVALLSGACLLPRRLGSVTAKFADRARIVRTTLVDYWVVPGAERTAGQAAAPARAITEADSTVNRDHSTVERDHPAVNRDRAAVNRDHPAVERDRADGGQNGLRPDVAIVPRALGADAVAGKPSGVRDRA
jgi:hypothetical protein